MISQENLDTPCKIKNDKSKEYSDPELTEISNLMENLDYETAKILLYNKLKKESDNVEALDILSEALINIGEGDEAIKVKYLFT